MIIKACSLDIDYTSYEEVKSRNVIAQGWSNSGDVSFFKEEANLDVYLGLIKGDNSKRNAFNELFKVQAGDVFIAFEGARIAGICEVPDDFEYVYQSEYEYSNAVFPVKWIDWEKISNVTPPEGFRPRNPVFNIHKQEIISYIEKFWEKYKKEHSLLIQPDEHNEALQKIKLEMPEKIRVSKAFYNNLLIKDIKMRNISDHIKLLEYKQQIILQGPPGTGKTYTAKDIAEMKIFNNISADKKDQKERLESSEQFKLIQFHPAYSYEDFVRGIIAKTIGTQVMYSTENKVLVEFAIKAMNNYRNSMKSEELLSKEQWFDKEMDEFKLEIIDKIDEEGRYTVTKSAHIFEVTKDSIRYTGDNWSSNFNIPISEIKKLYLLGVNERKEIKHVEGILGNTHHHATYYFNVLSDFKKFVGDRKPDKRELKKEELKPYILLIDEINRANLPSVLGELIYALEYRGDEVESIYEIDGDGKSIVLPLNLYIIGTMNTADRSVGHIDYAIRRRFAFVDMLPTIEPIKGFAKPLFKKVTELFIENFDSVTNWENPDLKKSKHLAADFRPEDVWIGHSYFITKEDENAGEEELKIKLKYEIIPILKEYLKDGIINDNEEVRNLIDTLHV